jgi:hypothetical protein
MKMFRYATFLFATLLFTVPVHAAQHAAQKPVSKSASTTRSALKPMGNADVVKMAKAGLGEDLVIASIRKATKTAFDTNVDGLVALKEAGVSDRVIAVMMDPKSPLDVPAPATVHPVPKEVSKEVDVVRSSFPKERGIYLVRENAVTLLQQARITGVKASGGFKAVFSYGMASMKMKYRVRGARAEIRTGNQPVFYVSGVEPSDLTVLKLEGKGKEREFTSSSIRGINGSVEAPEGDAMFKAEKYEGGYKLTFPEVLEAGEYGFAYMPGGGPTSGSVLFDFGVDSSTGSR